MNAKNVCKDTELRDSLQYQGGNKQKNHWLPSDEAGGVETQPSGWAGNHAVTATLLDLSERTTGAVSRALTINPG